jgi:hypothetical protein
MKLRKENLEIVLDQLMGLVIIINVITIGLSSDVGTGSQTWLVIDGVFACLFLAESIMKMTILGAMTFWCGSNRAWNLLEVGLVVFAWVELIIALVSHSGMDINVSLFRIIRLVRITRIVRVAKLPVFAELMMLINGAAGGMKTLLWSIVLILVPIYGVSLVLRETMGRDESVKAFASFNSMPMALFTTFRCIVAGDCSNADGEPIFGSGRVQPWYCMLYVVSLTLMTFGLFNVIVAIFVEHTVAAAKYNDVHVKKQRLLDQKVFSRKACEMVECIWHVISTQRPKEFNILEEVIEELGDFPRAADIVERAGAIALSHDLFDILKEDSHFQELLRELDIADDEQLDLFDTFDIDNSGSVELSELIFGIKKLRGDARKSDVVAINLASRAVLLFLEDVNKDMHSAFDFHEECLSNLATKCDGLEEMVREIAKPSRSSHLR